MWLSKTNTLRKVVDNALKIGEGRGGVANNFYFDLI